MPGARRLCKALVLSVSNAVGQSHVAEGDLWMRQGMDLLSMARETAEMTMGEPKPASAHTAGKFLWGSR